MPAQLKPVDSKDLRDLMSEAIGIIAPTMLEIMASGKFAQTVEGERALDIVGLCKMIVRRAVTVEAKTEDDDLIHAVALLMVHSMHVSGMSSGVPLPFKKLSPN